MSINIIIKEFHIQEYPSEKESFVISMKGYSCLEHLCIYLGKGKPYDYDSIGMSPLYHRGRTVDQIRMQLWQERGRILRWKRHKAKKGYGWVLGNWHELCTIIDWHTQYKSVILFYDPGDIAYGQLYQRCLQWLSTQM